MTESEFIAKEVAVWGEDYVFDLLDKGYVPAFITSLNKWVFLNKAQITHPKMSYVG